MWQGKSLIPRPKLSTPRRIGRSFNSRLSTSESKTPSRVVRPGFLSSDRKQSTVSAKHPKSSVISQSSREDSYPSQASAMLRPVDACRGDSLADAVISTGVLQSTPDRNQPKPYRPYDSENFKEYRMVQSSDYETDTEGSLRSADQAEQQDQTRKSMNSFERTPPEKVKRVDSIHPFSPDIHRTPRTAEYQSHLLEADKIRETLGCRRDLEIDEDLVTRTPSKSKNNEWLASFGIDVSLLKITVPEQDEENHDPNVTPGQERSPDGYLTYDTDRKSHTVAPPAMCRRRATDLHDTARARARQSMAGPPSRISSSRRTRRSSARVSTRELDALKLMSEFDDVENHDVDDVPRGSEVFLTPVRASRRQREKNGTEKVLSEVRRSLRLNSASAQLVPRGSVRGRIELLEANDHSFIPNPTLSDRSHSG